MNKARILNAYFYTGCHTAICACFLLLFYQLKAGIDPTFNIFLTLASLVWTGYCWTQLHILHDKNPFHSKKTTQLNSRFLLFKNNQSKVYILIFFLFIMSTYYLLNFNLFSFIIFSHLSVLLFFYQLPLKKYSLRKIPYLKAFLISYIWTTLICLIAIMPVNYEDLSQKIHKQIYFEIYFFILSLTLLFDYRDKNEDSSNYIRTFANIKFRDKEIIKALSLLSFLLSLIFYDYKMLKEFFPTICLYLLVLYKSSHKSTDLYYLSIIDSLMIAKGLNALQIHIT